MDITAEFREELYTNILDAYARIKEPEKEETQKQERTQEMPEFSVTVTPYEREGSNIKGLARIYFENSFIVNNINIVQGKEKIFVSMPSYKTKQVDEQGKPIYQDVCYPVTKDFREKLYNEIILSLIHILSELAENLLQLGRTLGEADNFTAVSYTHLDVYKRQAQTLTSKAFGL